MLYKCPLQPKAGPWLWTILSKKGVLKQHFKHNSIAETPLSYR